MEIRETILRASEWMLVGMLSAICGTIYVVAIVMYRCMSSLFRLITLMTVRRWKHFQLLNELRIVSKSPWCVDEIKYLIAQCQEAKIAEWRMIQVQTFPDPGGWLRDNYGW